MINGPGDGLHSNNDGCTDFLLITPNAIDSSVPLSAKDAEWLVELAGNSPESPTSSMAGEASDSIERVSCTTHSADCLATFPVCLVLTAQCLARNSPCHVLPGCP